MPDFGFFLGWWSQGRAREEGADGQCKPSVISDGHFLAELVRG